MATTTQVHIRSVRDEPADGDGFRVLVDRIWPRGVSKEAAALDEWLKDVGPSNDLRQWFGHDPEKFEEFAKRYEQELADNDEWRTLQQLVAEHGRVTLLFGAKDREHNQAVVLRDLLTR
ncbi:DUF488 domain-containing protein [Janibacter corallicola]|uniref:DUF488 domain-containing protein n=1 Tax=Janibacter corallicola TaxID=415212 RepID=UPI00082C8021|nr:DUF488 family protein [Janibacter corallicola]